MDDHDPLATEDAHSVIARVEGRLDEVAQRFDRTDWVELAAAVVLALATIVAAWSAYQSARWGGEQAKATAEANATRLAASTALNITGSQVAVDSQIVVGWLLRAVEGDERGMAEFESRVSDEMRPAFDAWLLTAEPGELPPGSPLDMPEYEEQALAGMAMAEDLGQQASAAADRAVSANQTSDDFVLIAVVMASVLFFAGVGSKFRGRRIRRVMVAIAAAVFAVGIGFMLSLPQNIGL